MVQTLYTKKLNNMETKEKQIITLVKQVIALKKDAKDTAAGYREEIKDLEKQITELIEEAPDSKKD